MSQLLSAFQDFPAREQVATYPDAITSQVTVTFSGSYFIKANNDLAVQNAWLIGNRDVLSWAFKLSPAAHRGASLIIHLGMNAEINPATNVNVWRVYMLRATGTTAGAPQNFMHGLKLPQLYCYFELVSGEANLTVDGYLRLEAGA